MPHDSNIITIYQSWAGKIFIQAPMREQQALDIASLIKEGHIVVLNLERCGSVESQKLLDFISGAAYAREYNLIFVDKASFEEEDKPDSGDFPESIK